MKTLLPLITYALLFISCKSSLQISSDVNGVWKSVGSGWILEIKDSSRYNLYDLNTLACVPHKTGTLDDLSKYISFSGDTLLQWVPMVYYRFVRVDQLPEMCRTKMDRNKANDIYFNYDVFAKTVEEHYAFMELNNINWPVFYKNQKAKLTDSASVIDLYILIDETLILLNDNHAFLEADDALYAAMEQTVPSISDVSAVPEMGDFQVANYVCDHHFIKEMTKDSKLIRWGLIEEDIGFIQIKAMWLYADLNIPQALIDELGYVDAFVETFHKMEQSQYISLEKIAVKKIMDQVMRDLQSTKSIIIDIRFNGGGQDVVSQEIIHRFNPTRTKVQTQQLKDGDTFTIPQEIFLPSHPDAYTKPVYVLISPQTGSAAESFAMSCRALNHVHLIGSCTMGATSTALEKKLPIGWYYSISNEYNVDNEGRNFENIGVPPDIELHYEKDRQTFFRHVANNLEQDKNEILGILIN